MLLSKVRLSGMSRMHSSVTLSITRQLHVHWIQAAAASNMQVTREMLRLRPASGVIRYPPCGAGVALNMTT